MLENYFFYLSNVGFYNARTGQVEKGVNGLLFANGLSGDDQLLFVSETNRRAVRQYQIITTTDKQGVPHIHLDHVAERKFDMAVDNVHYNQNKELVTVAGHPKALDFIKYIISNDGKSELPKPPSQVDVWDIKSGETKTLIQDDGVLFGTSTTGALDLENSKLVVSGLYEEGLLVCDV
jgi:sugar lactone lactonase YvrE